MRTRKMLGCAFLGAAIGAAIVGLEASFIAMLLASVPPCLGLILLFWEDTNE